MLFFMFACGKWNSNAVILEFFVITIFVVLLGCSETKVSLLLRSPIMRILHQQFQVGGQTRAGLAMLMDPKIKTLCESMLSSLYLVKLICIYFVPGISKSSLVD